MTANSRKRTLSMVAVVVTLVMGVLILSESLASAAAECNSPTSTATSQQFDLSPRLLQELLPTFDPNDRTMYSANGHGLRRKLIKSMGDAAKNFLWRNFGMHPESFSTSNPDVVKAEDPYAYFRFLPDFVGAALPKGTVSWKPASCFTHANITVTPTSSSGRSFRLDIFAGQQTGFLCSSLALVTTPSSVQLITLSSPGLSRVDWELPADTSEDDLYDATVRGGFKVFAFQGDLLKTVSDAIATFNLFEAMETQGISDAAMERNLLFMQEYARRKMYPRAAEPVDLDESVLHSGDFLGLVRMDGLDPVLAWAMGSPTGHTAVVLRMDGAVYVVESTTDSSFWPTNGIQKTPYKQWVQQVRAAGSSVVWAPLGAEARARFNEAAAVQYFKSLEGVDYGYSNFLLGWLDTLHNNYPCFAPDFKRCLSPEHFEWIIAAMDRLMPNVAERFVLQAMNHRLGTQGLRASALWRKAATSLGLKPGEVMAMVEDDKWLYNTTRYDKPVSASSRVCCAFVCAVWKASGLFGPLTDTINCAEQTNWDITAMPFVDPKPALPAACVQADPDNAHCQISGKHSLHLIDVATKNIFAHMGEKCPTKGPDYPRIPGC